MNELRCSCETAFFARLNSAPSQPSRNRSFIKLSHRCDPLRRLVFNYAVGARYDFFSRLMITCLGPLSVVGGLMESRESCRKFHELSENKASDLNLRASFARF